MRSGRLAVCGSAGRAEILAHDQAQIKLDERGPVTFATIGLSRRDYDQYYRGFSNATLWPTFHFRTDLTQYYRHEFDGYKRVNSWLAQQLLPLLLPDDVIWVHDYHLIPFAEALRAAGVKNRIGFFLHIPFPPAQILTTVPPHQALVKALCCYDLVGFQTPADLRSFVDYIVHEGRGTAQPDGLVTAFGRTLRAGAYPIGIYPDEIAELAQAGASRKPVQMLKQTLHDRKLIMAVDRLDYSKGLVERFRDLRETAGASAGVSQSRVALADRSADPFRRQCLSTDSLATRNRGRAHQRQVRRTRLDADSLHSSSIRARHTGLVVPSRAGRFSSRRCGTA